MKYRRLLPFLVVPALAACDMTDVACAPPIDPPSGPLPGWVQDATTTTNPAGAHYDPYDGCEYPLVRTVVGTCVMPRDDVVGQVSPCPPFSDGPGDIDYHDPSCYPK